MVSMLWLFTLNLCLPIEGRQLFKLYENILKPQI